MTTGTNSRVDSIDSMPRLPLVLLPGMDGTGLLFDPLVSALDSRLAPKVLSYPQDRLLDYQQLESVVRAQLPKEPFVLLGESFSGPLALSISAAPPPGLRGLILCSTFASNPRPFLGAFQPLLGLLSLSTKPTSAFAWPAKHALLGNFATPALEALLEKALHQISPAVMAHRLREVAKFNVLSKLAQIRVPVLYLQATRDRLVPAKAAAEIARSIPSMQVQTIEGPHCLLQASPVAAAAAINAFCSQLEVAAG